MTLSVCLIVKDEQDVIARCLNCASKFADEIIVVDTGFTFLPGGTIFPPRVITLSEKPTATLLCGLTPTTL